jgi:hypothetical protein
MGGFSILAEWFWGGEPTCLDIHQADHSPVNQPNKFSIDLYICIGLFVFISRADGFESMRLPPLETHPWISKTHMANV